MRMNKAATIAQYLRSVPAKQRAALQKVRKAIHAAAPGSVETISYGIPAFKHRGRMLIYFAAFKQHNSLFPATKGFVAAHRKELEGYYTSGKGTLRFDAEKPLPAALLKKLVKWRIQENAARYPEAP
jgi:uncharacterized protein YdhG (YjbR/CyaY superfamily)